MRTHIQIQNGTQADRRNGDPFPFHLEDTPLSHYMGQTLYGHEFAHKIKWRDFLDFRETKDVLIKIAIQTEVEMIRPSPFFSECASPATLFQMAKC